jgi:hypothetical protein
MSSEICPGCHELIEHGGISLDGTPIPPGSRGLDPIHKVRVCLNCMPYKVETDIEDRPPPAGFYADLHRKED